MVGCSAMPPLPWPRPSAAPWGARVCMEALWAGVLRSKSYTASDGLPARPLPLLLTALEGRRRRAARSSVLGLVFEPGTAPACCGLSPSLARAAALILSAVPALMLPAFSERVAPEIARRAWVGSEIGKLLPGPAKLFAGILARRAAVRRAISASFRRAPGRARRDRRCPCCCPRRSRQRRASHARPRPGAR